MYEAQTHDQNCPQHKYLQMLYRRLSDDEFVSTQNNLIAGTHACRHVDSAVAGLGNQGLQWLGLRLVEVPGPIIIHH